MLNLINKIMQPLIKKDTSDRRMVLIVIGLSFIAVSLLYFVDISQELTGFLSIFLLIAFVMAWRGILQIAGVMAPLVALLGLTWLLFRNFGIRDTALVGLPVVIVAASLLNGRRGTFVFGGASLLAISILGITEMNGWVVNAYSNRNSIADYLTVSIAIMLITLLQWAVIGRLEENIHQAQREVAERQHTEQTLQQRADEMSLLYQMGLALTSGEDLYTTLRALVKDLKRLMVVDAFHVGFYDEATDIFLYSLFLNLDEDSQPPPRKLRDNPGLTWEVISKRQTLYLPDMTDPVTQKNHHIIWIRDVGMRSYIGIPLVLNDRVIGVMSVQALAPSTYTSEQIRFLETLAAQVAITVEKSRLFTNVQQRAAQLATMNEIGRTVSTLQNIDSVFEVIYQQVQRIASVDAFYICLYDSELEQISFPLTYDMGQRYSEPAIPLQPDIAISKVIRTGLPFILHRTPEELQTPVAGTMGTSRRSASILIVPLWLGQKVFGVLSVQSYTLNAYSEELANILTGIGHQAAIAIENARLFTNLQQELAERQHAETQLQTSLREKEVLLKEVHHRVKNNMQVIVSMLSLQSAYLSDEVTLTVLRESQNRVRSMALVHEKLYQSSNLAQIDFRDYLQHLASTLFHSYSPNISHIDLVIEVKECILSVDVAIPCGLIVNELISNALKHGFPNNRPGRVVVSLQQIESGELELAVIDNGVGIPIEKNWRKTESLGMQLVQSLTKQIQGSIILERLQPGTKFIVTFATY